MNPELKQALLDYEVQPPLDCETEAIVAASTDPDITWWVGTVHGLRTSTVAAHIVLALEAGDFETLELLRANPSAPLEDMRRVPMNRQTNHGLERFLARSGFNNESDHAGLLSRKARSRRTLGAVWDEALEKYGSDPR